VERREDPEWLLILVESSKYSRKIFDKMKLEFTPARCCIASVFDQARGGGGLDFFKMAPTDKRRKAGAGDGQWGDLVRRIGNLLEKAQTNRFAKYTITEDDSNFCAHFVACENLIFAYLQADKFVKALELYDALEATCLRLQNQGDPVVEKMIRLSSDPGNASRPSALKFCFPDTVSASSDFETIQHQQAFPARILDVSRFPFRDLIATSAVSHLQVVGYLFSRRMLLLLALGLPWRASQVAQKFMLNMRKSLKRAYDVDLDVIDAWTVASSLELVAAGHGCAAVFSSSVSASARVALSACQADMLEQSVAALDDISKRCGPSSEDFVPFLCRNNHPKLDSPDLWNDWPPGLARALSSCDVFRVLYVRLLEAAAAHSIAAGRFRCAASLTHRRALITADDNLFLDSSRWWSGEPRPVLVEGKVGMHFFCEKRFFFKYSRLFACRIRWCTMIGHLCGPCPVLLCRKPCSR